ncbi:MAG TPA: hypothetical protein VM802_01690 [Chitinophaga sp.]|uniref:hypothetical protein n=1 Tax=Chitinophaga sp. TaxID=1869181 RepID=UPI002B822A81|nr:hypothetical protein [Chitinophaga sp.]HVI43544.1 hypothetical protein [Chitinophaga sp.]
MERNEIPGKALTRSQLMAVRGGRSIILYCTNATYLNCRSLCDHNLQCSNVDYNPFTGLCCLYSI